MLVVRDTFYQGWQATVDGQATPVLRADFLYRAVPMPPGTHLVELHFRSRAFERGLVISAIAGLLTLALAYAPLPGLPRSLRRQHRAGQERVTSTLL
jgi:uncharacterized membrane protein YfhO